MLGKGAFGTVYSGQQIKTGQLYAVKCIDKSKLVSEVRAAPAAMCLQQA